MLEKKKIEEEKRKKEMEERQETDSMGSDSNHGNQGLSKSKLPKKKILVRKLSPEQAVAALRHILRSVRDLETKVLEKIFKPPNNFYLRGLRAWTKVFIPDRTLLSTQP